MKDKQKPNLIPFIIISLVALPIFVTGIISYSAPEILPWPENPSLTWSMLGVGFFLDVVAVFVLITELMRVGRINAELS